MEGMEMEITQDTFEDVASQIDGEVYSDYSGRGMYGKTCPGIVHDVPDVLLGAVLARTLLERGEGGWIEEIAADARTDKMGYSTITYFPNLALIEGDQP